MILVSHFSVNLMDFIKVLKEDKLNSVIIYGPHGVGKSHLLNIIKLDEEDAHVKYIACRSLIQIERGYIENYFNSLFNEVLQIYSSSLESSTAIPNHSFASKQTRIVLLIDDIDRIVSKHSKNTTDASVLSCFICFIDRIKRFNFDVANQNKQRREQHEGAFIIMTCSDIKGIHKRVYSNYRIDRMIPFSIPNVYVRKLTVLYMLWEIVLVNRISLHLDVLDRESCSESHPYPSKGDDVGKCLDYCLFILDNVALRIATQTQGYSIGDICCIVRKSLYAHAHPGTHDANMGLDWYVVDSVCIHQCSELLVSDFQSVKQRMLVLPSNSSGIYQAETHHWNDELLHMIHLTYAHSKLTQNLNVDHRFVSDNKQFINLSAILQQFQEERLPIDMDIDTEPRHNQSNSNHSYIQFIEPQSLVDNMHNKTPEMKHDINLVGLESIQKQLRSLIVEPYESERSKKLYNELNIRPCRGCIIQSPPGCGKTALAHWMVVVGKEYFKCISISCADLVNKTVGDSEQKIVNIFRTARKYSPCFLLLENIENILGMSTYAEDESDEEEDGAIDSRNIRKSKSIGRPDRKQKTVSKPQKKKAVIRRNQRTSHNALDRMLSTLLIEIDGISMDKEQKPVIVIATTTNSSCIDKSLLRPGRLEEHIVLEYPSMTVRYELVMQKLYQLTSPFNSPNGRNTITLNMLNRPMDLKLKIDPSCEDVAKQLAEYTDGKSPAELIQIMNEGWLSVIKELILSSQHSDSSKNENTLPVEDTMGASKTWSVELEISIDTFKQFI